MNCTWLKLSHKPSKFWQNHMNKSTINPTMILYFFIVFCVQTFKAFWGDGYGYSRTLLLRENAEIGFWLFWQLFVSIQVHSLITRHICSADSFPPPERHSHKGVDSTVDLTLDRAPGTHHSWVGRGSVDSKLAQGFAHMTSTAGIEPQTLGSLVQCLNHSATCCTNHTH